ncbi:MAG TPA: metallophosphoesterase family protein [Vicinamibacterales bacterium]|nr:metallophosphoesterase family protein [Vicinamibacterales bacterium]
MRYLILSDLHANLQALDATLADAATVGYDEVLILGDLVGYGGDPAAVIDRTMGLSSRWLIRGNHDKVCAGIESPVLFNDVARIAAEWTHDTLSPDHLATLAKLPMGPVQVSPEIEICHGAPFDEDYYVFEETDAARAMASATARICLFGHTHVPTLFAKADDPFGGQMDGADEYRLPVSGPALINVGSVGQPRDRDPRAAYGLLDTDRGTITLRRVAYDIAGAQAQIVAAGLPAWLALRLERGQ